MDIRGIATLLALVGILTIPTLFRGQLTPSPGQGATAALATQRVEPDPTLSFPIAADMPQKPAPATPSKQSGAAADPALIAPKESDTQNIPEPTYPHDPLPFDAVNALARAAVVNIFCETKSGGSFEPISGSGVIIDPRGIILTNAHVAQYMLLAESQKIAISCVVRSGSPATPKYHAKVLYLPAEWITEHAAEIRVESPTGTGEHDFALLYITGPVGNNTLPEEFPYLPFDAREGAIASYDQALVAGYPAGFVGGILAQRDLYASSAVTNIGQLYTFDESHTVDLISLGGVILAQAGSSGGPVVNAWGYLVGIVATSSFGEATEARDLRAITVAHINRSMQAELGTDLLSFLSDNPATLVANFTRDQAPALIKKLIDAIENPTPATQ